MTGDNTVQAKDLDYIVEKFPHLEAFEDKTILITGFAGFLGYYLTHFFLRALELGTDIKSLVLLDNFMLRTPNWVSQLPKWGSKIQVESFDVATDGLAPAVRKYAPDYIVHMASIASPTFYRKYPVETLDANVLGLRHLLDAARDLPLAGMLVFSSSEVYGDPPSDAIPTAEDYRGNVASIGPRACYDEAKRFSETLCYVFAETYNLPICIVRPFNNFGPGMSIDDKRAPADLARAVLRNEDIVLYSDGSPTRTFCYVADATVGYLKALTYGKFDYFNIGMEGPEVSVREFAEIYQRVGKAMLGYTGSVRFEKPVEKGYLTHNPARRCPDMTKARRFLQFEPEITTEEGVGRFLTYLRQEEEK
jgi:UDP-glucuronate decarboxylase